ncbi:S8 family serine peptidase [Streptococcus equi subsp. zooepidemicus]|nr:S8 family serine peptidase [Streptococcus equi]MDI6043971.1 S8 family serine peptidase [Streptococcus equi subsp. zooepidemicus]HEL0024539.1 S8 family serine peptidase [Streptococcus equi subsp. zooepidemicus]HEL1117402.1 S8 family serine peptidase [Streptococcus equi subsp. zooepidemicus]HEL1170974.1 S8 family serine peptidase [Streptococcus equi subsp. zooepidemicus]
MLIMKHKMLTFCLLLSIFVSQLRILHVSAETSSKTQYNILIKESLDINKVKKQLDNQGIIVLDEIPEINVLTIATSNDSSMILEKNSNYIDDISRNNTFTVNPKMTYQFGHAFYLDSDLNYWNKQWDMQRSISTSSRFWHKSSGEVTIGVIDSGITDNNTDISSKVISVQNFTEDPVTGAIDVNNVLDKTGHGTSVVGQMSSNGYYTGIAPGMKVRMYKVFEEGNAQDEWILKAIIQAAKDDVDVINLSLGQYLLKDSSNIDEDRTALINSYQRAINYAHKQGSVVVASVGDEGANLNNQAELKNLVSTLTGRAFSSVDGTIEDIPAQLDNVVTVGSVDGDGAISSFSNRGMGVVDIFTAGGGSKKLALHGYDTWINNKLFEQDWVIIPTLEGKYTYGYGTSIAAPKVAAALGLIIEKYDLKDKPDEAITILYSNSWSSLDDNGKPIRLLNITDFISK